ncbi:MAG: hypothetical protein H7257_12565 [Taibaiella sp.]|nr:hypothetical protein [Taibaiella sp.]
MAFDNIVLRQKLQLYLDRVYSGAQIDTEHTIGGPVHIRFELGGNLRNGTKKRVNQAVERALAIINELFSPADEIMVLSYDYLAETNSFNDAQYLWHQFPKESLAAFYSQVECANTRNFITDKDGNEFFEKANEKIVIGELPG